MHRLAKGVENNRLLQENIALEAQNSSYREGAELSDQLREEMEEQLSNLVEQNKMLRLQLERTKGV